MQFHHCCPPPPPPLKKSFWPVATRVGAGVVRSRRFLGEVGFLTTLGVRFLCPTPEVRLDHFYIALLNWEFLLKWYNFCWNGIISVETFVETDISCCVHDFHWFQQPKFIPLMLRSRSLIFFLRLRNPGGHPWKNTLLAESWIATAFQLVGVIEAAVRARNCQPAVCYYSAISTKNNTTRKIVSLSNILVWIKGRFGSINKNINAPIFLEAIFLGAVISRGRNLITSRLERNHRLQPHGMCCAASNGKNRSG